MCRFIVWSVFLIGYVNVLSLRLKMVIGRLCEKFFCCLSEVLNYCMLSMCVGFIFVVCCVGSRIEMSVVMIRIVVFVRFIYVLLIGVLKIFVCSKFFEVVVLMSLSIILSVIGIIVCMMICWMSCFVVELSVRCIFILNFCCEMMNDVRL